MESGLSELARRVAKIIDPDSWAVLDKYPDAPKLRGFARQRSIAKANEILALTRAPSDAALVEALERLVVNYGEPHPLARAHLETEDLRFARAALAAAKGQQP